MGYGMVHQRIDLDGVQCYWGVTEVAISQV